MGLCAKCGHENPEGARFCNACAAPLAAELSAGVRKTVTIIFCDLVGSPSLGDRADPEVLRELMRSYHAELRAILERHGGTVEKFVGDAAMAVFGIPYVHEDDALRAVRAAAEIREAVGRLGLDVRIGLNTGEVVAGGGETLVTGDAVNVAARLEQVATAGEILIGEGTHALLRTAVRDEPVEPLALKGKAEPVPAHRLLEVLPDVPAFTRPVEPPFVGRQNELMTMEQTLGRAIGERSLQLVTIVGPPGIGKSRLARELIQHSKARVLVGRCLSYGEGITYWPLSEIVAQVGDVRSALGGDRDAELAESRIGAAVGTGDAAASSEEIAWGFRKLFQAIAHEQPLIIVLDDIHWAEPTLLDLIEYVSTFARAAPLLLLCMARPDLFELRPSWAGPKPNATVLTLGPLAEEETETLVVELRDVPNETKGRIVEAAEGNPLFVEQLVAMQEERGDGELEIPPTIHALLTARIDRLEPGERAVIECASIEGRLFHRGSVAELLPGRARAGVGGHLMTLVRKELIRPDRAAIPGDDGFRFGHILIRDAAYESIPKRLRSDLHERFANWLESKLGQDTPGEILAYHLEQAHRYASELWRSDQHVARLAHRAADRLASAGRIAAVRGDAPAASTLLQRAVDLLPSDDERRVALLLDLTAALRAAGDLLRAEEVVDTALGAARARGDRASELRAAIERESLLLLTNPEGTVARMSSLADEATALFERLGDDLGLARAWELVSEVAWMRCRFGESAVAIRRALEYLDRIGDRSRQAHLTGRLGGAWLAGPMPVEEMLPRLEAALESAAGDPLTEANLLRWVALAQAYRGDFERGRDLARRRKSLVHEFGLRLELALNEHLSGHIEMLAGDLETAEAFWRVSCQLLGELGEQSHLSTRLAELAQKSLYPQGKYEEAERFARLAEETGASDDIETQARWRGALAKVLGRSDPDTAEILVREAIGLVEETDLLELHGDIFMDEAEVLRLIGRGDEARTVLEEALAVYERKGIVPEIGRVRGLLS